MHNYNGCIKPTNELLNASFS
uniref:Uncharacterized protein n=1 Tax=Moniliophthora roreri TaxID=221103 RepID=A0A0W0FCW7_MONRR